MKTCSELLVAWVWLSVTVDCVWALDSESEFFDCLENLEIQNLSRKKEEEQWILKNVYSYEQFARMYAILWWLFFAPSNN